MAALVTMALGSGLGDPTSDPQYSRLRLVMRGRVQGVYFRQTAQEVARGLGLTGWVRNNPDGSVEAVAEGRKEALEQFAAWCRHGPPGAWVKEAEVDWEPATGEFRRFDIRGGGW